MNNFYTYLSGAALALSSSLSFADAYVGISAGKTDIDIAAFDDGSSIAIMGGYKVNKNFAVELSYIDLGDFEDDVAPKWTIELDGFNFAAIGIIPVSEKIDIFGKVGMFMWDVSLKESGFGELDDDDGTDISLGLGMSLNITEQFGIVAEYQKFDLDDGDAADNLSIGARFNF